MSSPSAALRVGIIGAGIRGTLLAKALRQHPDVEVVGVCDRDQAMAEHLAKDLDVPAFPAHESLLGAGLGLQAVVVATPDFAHRQAAVDAAVSGLHLLVEKPLATTIEDAAAIAAAVDAAGVRCMTGFENRWNPRFILARQLVQAGELGELLVQTAHLHDTTFVPTQMLSWAARSSPVWFLMPHTVDLLLWLSAKVPAAVYATGVKRHLRAQGIDTWDAVDAMVTFTDGTTATLHSMWVLPESFPAVFDLRLELTGTRSALRIEGSHQGLEHLTDRLRWPQWGVYETGGVLRGFPVDMALTFANWLLDRTQDVPTAADGLQVTTVLSAIDQSLATGVVTPIGSLGNTAAQLSATHPAT